ncbi:MAG: transcriptional regulator, LysR family [Herminiimonas sp.]|nr:transcriptional regulator, LysR family [Herminiimonas sp.]
MTRSIPPLNPLRVFEAAARLGSFTRAAEELHVSQSAVSRQVSILEDYLNLKLFKRELRGIALTEAGQAYQKEIGPAFARIAIATQDLLADSRGGPVNLRAYTTFAAKWLLQRLPKFEAAHPDIQVRLSTIVTPVDFEKENVDVAIQFGDGNWDGVSCERLFDDEITPVCSPKLLEAMPLQQIEDLKQHRLLHSRYRKTDWPDWLSAVGHPELAGQTDTMQFASSIVTYQAAIDGLGVAIGQVPLLEQELQSGRLVRPFTQVVQRPFAYYLLLPRRDSIPAKVEKFRTWLLQETAPLREPNSP